MRQLIVLIAILSSLNGFSQWEELNSNTTEDLTAVFMVNENIGYCTGFNGVIVKTVDGGENWINIGFNNDEICYVYFKDPENGLIISDNNIYQTSNGNDFVDINASFTISGYNFSDVNFTFQNDFGLIKIRHVNPNNGSDTFYKTYKTDNFGSSWQIMNDINFSGGFYFITNPDVYYYVWIDELKKTIDGGETWANIPNMNFTLPFYQTFQIFDNNTGIATEFYEYDYFTFDINNNSVIRYSTSYYKGFDFIGNKGFYLNGGYGGDDKFLRSFDYGLTLIEVGDLEPSGVFHGIDFVDENLGFICGNDGYIYRTENGGGLGIDGNDILGNRIKIHPIPAKDSVNLELPTDLGINSLELYDINGKLIKSFKTTETRLNLTAIASGNYVLKIDTNQGSVTKKVIIE